MPDRATIEHVPSQHRPDRTLSAREQSQPFAATHVPPGPAYRALNLQGVIGNQAVQRILQREAAPPTATLAIQRKTVKIGDEKVIVKNKEEQAEAEAILKRIKDNYGIEVSSKTTVEGIKEQYTDVKEKVKKKLKAREWRMIELRALERALKAYAPILGGERAKSTRSGDDQEVTSVGKVKQAIDTNQPSGKLDTTTLGEYFRGKKNMGLFKASEKFVADFDNEADQLTGTFVHEIAHGLLEYSLNDYIAATGFWKDRYTKLADNKRTESPVTDYGHKNAAEDLCESAMVFFVKPDRLKKNCPKRHAFMEKLGKDWLPPPAQAPQVQTPPSEVPKSETVKEESAPTPDVDLTVFDDLLKMLEDLSKDLAEDTTTSTTAPTT